MPDFSSFSSLPSLQKSDFGDVLVSDSALLKLFNSDPFANIPKLDKQSALDPIYKESRTLLKHMGENSIRSSVAILTGIKALEKSLESTNKSSALVKSTLDKLVEVKSDFESQLEVNSDQLAILSAKIDKLAESLSDTKIKGDLKSIVNLFDTKLSIDLKKALKESAVNKFIDINSFYNTDISSNLQELTNGILSLNTYLDTLTKDSRKYAEIAYNQSLSKLDSEDMISKIIERSLFKLGIDKNIANLNPSSGSSNIVSGVRGLFSTSPTAEQEEILLSLESTLKLIERNTAKQVLSNADKIKQEDKYEEEQDIQIRIAEALESLVERDNLFALDQDSIDKLAEAISDSIGDSAQGDDGDGFWWDTEERKKKKGKKSKKTKGKGSASKPGRSKGLKSWVKSVANSAAKTASKALPSAAVVVGNAAKTVAKRAPLIGTAIQTVESGKEYANATNDKERKEAAGGFLGALAGAAAGAGTGTLIGGPVGTVIGAVGGFIGSYFGVDVGKKVSGWFSDVTDQIPDEYIKKGKVYEIYYIVNRLRPSVVHSITTGDGTYKKDDLDDLDEYYIKLFKEVAFNTKEKSLLLSPELFTPEQIATFKYMSSKLLKGDPLTANLSESELKRYKNQSKITNSQLESALNRAKVTNPIILDNIQNEAVKLYKTLHSEGRIQEAEEVYTKYTQVMAGHKDEKTLEAIRIKYANEIANAKDGNEKTAEALLKLSEAIEKDIDSKDFYDSFTKLAKEAGNLLTSDSTFPADTRLSPTNMLTQLSTLLGVGKNFYQSNSSASSVSNTMSDTSQKFKSGVLSGSSSYDYVNNLIANGVKYHNTGTRGAIRDANGNLVTGKDISQGYIDCSGLVTHIFDNLIGSIDQGLATVEEKSASKSLFKESAAGIIKNVSDKTGVLYSGIDDIKKNLKEGMVIGETWGTGTSGRFKNISHITTVVKDPNSGNLMIAESSSSKGVKMSSVEDYFRGRSASVKSGKLTGIYAADGYQAINNSTAKDLLTTPTVATQEAYNESESSDNTTDPTTPVDGNSTAGRKAILLNYLKSKNLPGHVIAGVLAQVEVETANFKYMHELGKRSYFTKYERGEKAQDLGNTSPGDGYKYRGRGYIQLTGKGNYAKVGKKLGIDLVNNPDLAADPKVAVRTMDVFLQTVKQQGKTGWYWANERNWLNLSRFINGWYSPNRINHYKERMAATAKYLKMYDGKSSSSIASGYKPTGNPVSSGGNIGSGKLKPAQYGTTGLDINAKGEMTVNQPQSAPIYIGDSIAHGYRTAAGAQGTTLPGASPSKVLGFVHKYDPNDLRGRNVVLSSGLSNNTSDYSSIEKQLKYLKTAGANVSLIGVSNNYKGNKESAAQMNSKLSQLARNYGATFTGGFVAGKDTVHPRSYKNLSIAATSGKRVSASAPTSNMTAYLNSGAYNSSKPETVQESRPDGLSLDQARELDNLMNQGLTSIPQLAAATGVSPDLIHNRLSNSPRSRMEPTGNNLTLSTLKISAARVEIVGGLPQNVVSVPAKSTNSSGALVGPDEPFRISDQGLQFFSQNIT